MSRFFFFLNETDGCIMRFAQLAEKRQVNKITGEYSWANTVWGGAFRFEAYAFK